MELRRSTRSTRGRHSNPDRDFKHELRHDESGDEEQEVQEQESHSLKRKKPVKCNNCSKQFVPDSDSVYTCPDCKSPAHSNVDVDSSTGSNHVVAAADDDFEDDDDGVQIKRRTKKKRVLEQGPVEHIDELRDKVRQSVANVFNTTLSKLMASGTEIEVNLASYGSDSVEEYVERLSLQIEEALYHETLEKNSKSKSPGPKYRDKMRALVFNLKDAKNEEFGKNVLTGKIVPSVLVGMTNEEMMNPELQQLAENVRKESIRESTLKADDEAGVRIRRTHKGEEVIEVDEDFDSANQFTHRIEGPEKERSLSPAAGEFDSGSDEGSLDPSTIINDTSSGKSSVTPQEDENKKLQQQQQQHINDMYNTTLDMDMYSYSPANSPEGVSSHDSSDEEDHGDEELERLMNNDDKDNMLDQSSRSEGGATAVAAPTAAPFAETQIWEGKVQFVGLAEFEAKALHLHSTDEKFEARKDWESVLDFSSGGVVVEGRLDKAKAETYINNVASIKDVITFILEAETPDQLRGYDMLYDYFSSRSKFGVIRNRSANIKDAYICPISKAEPIPDFLQLTFDKQAWLKSKLEKQSRMIVGLLVVNQFPSTTTSSASMSSHSGYLKHAPHLQNAAPPNDLTTTSSSLTPPAAAVSNPGVVNFSAGEAVASVSAAAAQAQMPDFSNLGLTSADIGLLQQIIQEVPQAATNPAVLVAEIQRRQQQR